MVKVRVGVVAVRAAAPITFYFSHDSNEGEVRTDDLIATVEQPAEVDLNLPDLGGRIDLEVVQAPDFDTVMQILVNGRLSREFSAVGPGVAIEIHWVPGPIQNSVGKFTTSIKRLDPRPKVRAGLDRVRNTNLFQTISANQAPLTLMGLVIAAAGLVLQAKSRRQYLD